MLTDSQSLDLKSLHLCKCPGQNQTKEGLFTLSPLSQTRLRQPKGAGLGRAALSLSERLSCGCRHTAPSFTNPFVRVISFLPEPDWKKKNNLGYRTIFSQYLSLTACTPFSPRGCIYVYLELSLPFSLLSSYKDISYTCLLG